jgi:hypothetical protein
MFFFKVEPFEIKTEPLFFPVTCHFINIHIGLTNMKLSTLAKLTLIGLGYVYTIKLVSTFYRGIFDVAAVAGTVAGLNILAGLVQLLFFITLYRQFVPKEKQALGFAAGLSIAGSVVALLPKVFALFQLIGPPAAFGFMSIQVYAFGPWLAAVFLLTFSFLFFRDDSFSHNKPLRWAFAVGVVGWFIMASAQSLVVVQYLSTGRLVWFRQLFAAGPIVFVTLSGITFLCLCGFYLAFARLDTTTP